METQVESNSDVGVSTLIGGIVQDARELLVEQMTLFQVEIKHDLRRTVEAVAPLILGGLMMLPGIILLGIGAAYFLNWAWPALPLWVAFAIAGGATIGVGALLILWGKSMLAKISLTPDKALQGLKENIQWKTKN